MSLFLKTFTAAMAFALVMTVLNSTSTQTTFAQETDDDNRAKIKKVKYLVDRGGKLFKKSEFATSAKKIREAQQALIDLAESKDEAVIQQLEKDYKRILKAQKLLKSKGEQFSKMPKFESFLKTDSGGDGSDPFFSEGSDSKDSGGSGSKASDAKNEGSGTKDGSSTKDDNMVSFKNDVAPIIVEHCGKCHIQQELGKYNASTYTTLKKGTRKGMAVKPGNVEKSRMIILVEAGAMPPKGAKVPANKLKILKDWIEQGARFDGDKKERKESLVSFATADSEGSDSKGSSSKDPETTFTTPGVQGGPGSG